MTLAPIEDVIRAAEQQADIAKLRRDAENLRPKSPLAGVKFAQGGYVGSGEPIKGRLFLHDHDGRTCEIAGGAHYPVVTADEVRRSTYPALLKDLR